MADRFELVGTTLADRYHVESLVAEGGFASVYRAFQLALARPVAIKVLKTPAELDGAARGRFRERFAAEARTIAHLRHAHIVDVYDFGVTRLPSGEVAPWMALEWLDGETLETELGRRRGAGGRSAAEAIALIRPVVEALAHAHARGIIHRDIKPANLVFSGPSQLRMLDFGIAKTMGAGDTDAGSRPGGGGPGFSPDYASPEQVTYSRTGPWTDVHALGLLLTELVTDEPPFSEGPDELLFEQIMAPARPTPRRRGKDVGALEAVIAKAVAQSPGRRWRDAGALLAALDAIAARVPRAPRNLRAPRSPATVTTEVTAVARRRRDIAVAGAGGLAVLSLFATLAWTLAASESRRPSVSRELALAESVRGKRVAARARLGLAPSAGVEPWIVPLPACPPSDAVLPEPGIATSAARRPTRPPRPSLSAAEPPPQGPCAVTINSVPWSQVWIDGRNTGRHTPFVDYEVGCGPHRIEFRRPDLALAQSESIVVRPGETFKARYTLAEAAEAAE
jgi:serine/threonine protein kinase